MFFYGGEAERAHVATLIVRNIPALIRSRRPRLFYKFENHRGHCPLIAGLTRFILIYCGASRCRYDVVPVGPGVQLHLTF